jgi:peptidyl-prolyl cis-trans isomerase A (cyclophilin A)
MSALSLSACVFNAPPPLPEEMAAENEAEAARLAALRTTPPPAEPAKEAGAGGGGEEAPEADPARYKAGEVAAPGMSPAEMRAFNTAQGDPKEGVFTLEEALAGLPGNGALWVEFVTSRGVINCELFEREAPNTIANFVGLARGLRPFLKGGEWTTGPYYDGVTFHRVIPGFMIQAGDPTGTGTGNPGYVIQDEIGPTHTHDDAGILSMANRGPGTGGAQFFITLGPTPHLDGKHTVFGRCDEAGAELADDIALVPRDSNDRPNDPEVIETVRIVRR